MLTLRRARQTRTLQHFSEYYAVDLYECTELMLAMQHRAPGSRFRVRAATADGDGGAA